LLGPLLQRCHIHRTERSLCPDDGWALVFENGRIDTHPSRRAGPAEWAWVLAHALLHLAFNHFRKDRSLTEWNVSACVAVIRFQRSLRFACPPEGIVIPDELPTLDEERLYEQFRVEGVPRELGQLGVAGPKTHDLQPTPERHQRDLQDDSRRWQDAFARALENAVGAAVARAGGELTPKTNSVAERARRWFVDSYPLLGALAASFRIIEEPKVLERLRVSTAAVSPSLQEIYIDARRLDAEEARFVMAHELLHVGLRHEPRRLGRDPYLWNVACDYVINGWLLEMGVGRPLQGGLFEPALRGLSAEAVYEVIARDLRRYRKLCTMRGRGLPDVLDARPDWWLRGDDGVALDDFYRRCLLQGLDYHCSEGRGLLPAGLVEEVRALCQPPIPWDVKLARWFDQQFEPLARRRSYARPSRRQASTPEIPRPRWSTSEEARESRTFGVVLDTSGSMCRDLLARALGAIASYAVAHDVSRVRVVFADAQAYDQGSMAVEEIGSQPVKLKGRGGTVLQPALDHLEQAEDFPKAAPVLIITDGVCDSLVVRREHAFLVPEGRTLPFPPRGPVFNVA